MDVSQVTKDAYLGIDQILEEDFTAEASISKSKREESYYRQVIHKLIEQLRVTCFSEDNANTLMWSHYADNHKGFCLEFEYPIEEQTLFSYLSPVYYTKDYPCLVLPSFQDDFMPSQQYEEIINKFVLTKDKVWEYEKEQRIVFTNLIGIEIPDKRKNKIYYPEVAVSKIFFGCNCNTENKNTLIQLCKKRQRLPEVYQLVTKKTGFGYDLLSYQYDIM